jgi:RNA polymerase-binding transcription factor DksA
MQQLQGGRRITRRERGKTSQQNAPHQDAAAAEPVDQVSAQQAENSAGDGGNVEHPSDPVIELDASRLGRQEFGQCRLDGEREGQ